MSDSRDYAQAGQQDPDQLTCKLCGSMVHLGATAIHTRWHRNFGELINNELVKYQRSRS
jgi:hypothetical protein